MHQPLAGQAAAVYRIRVAGRLDERWSPWFGDLALTADEHGTTDLTGVIPDQAALHGLLGKVRDLGLPLISVLRVDPDGGADR
jgi:hypothetical protein